MRNIKNKGHKHEKNKITNENNPGLIENIHKRQSQNLALLIELDEICRKNNLYYSVAYETALGAVREHKFIDWDGDVDVFISLETYQFLLKNYPNRLITSKIKHHMYQFPRFIKENDIDTNNPNSSYIDMFVLVPTTTKKATHYVRSLWNKMEAAQASAQRTTYFKHKVGWWTLKILTHLFMFWIPRLTIEKAQNKVLETAKPEILFAVSWPTYSHDFKYQWQLPLNYMEHTKDIEINDHIFKINSDIEKHLANWYGDNWRIPIKSNKAIFYGYYECYKK